MDRRRAGSSGIQIDDAQTLVLAGVVLGVVNAIVRPIAVILTFPLTIVTLGFFLLVVNAGMLGLTAWLLHGFHIAGFGSARRCEPDSQRHRLDRILVQSVHAAGSKIYSNRRR